MAARRAGRDASRSGSSPAWTSTPAGWSRASTSGDLRDAGDPVEMARVYDAEGADELVFLDITASSGGRETMFDVVRRTAEQVFIPLTVGGGVRTADDVDRLLRAGADKVGVNTAAIARPELLRRGGAAVRGAVHRAVGRRPRACRAGSAGPGRRRAGRGHHPRRPARHRDRRRRVGGARPGAGRRGDPAELDGRRRHPRRLRPGDDRGGAGRGRRAGDRQRRRRPAGRLRRRRSPRAPTPCWRPASSTSASCGSREVKHALAEAGVPVR